ncbi:MAG: hypothetical protein HQM10_18940 [Candidatus Riflebacteria bacterium]|nr:hypothetical protein [Candidatus Riflebacteria bacterium]
MKVFLKLSVFLVVLLVISLSSIKAAMAENGRFAKGIKPTRGTAEGIICPHCNKSIDLSALKSAMIKIMKSKAAEVKAAEEKGGLVKTGWFGPSDGDTEETTGVPGLKTVTTIYYKSNGWTFKSDLEPAKDPRGAKAYSISSGGKKGDTSVKVFESTEEKYATHTINQDDGTINKGAWK